MVVTTVDAKNMEPGRSHRIRCSSISFLVIISVQLLMTFNRSSFVTQTCDEPPAFLTAAAAVYTIITVIHHVQEAQLLLGDRATRKHAKDCEMDVEMRS